MLASELTVWGGSSRNALERCLIVLYCCGALGHQQTGKCRGVGDLQMKWQKVDQKAAGLLRSEWVAAEVWV